MGDYLENDRWLPSTSFRWGQPQAGIDDLDESLRSSEPAAYRVGAHEIPVRAR